MKEIYIYIYTTIKILEIFFEFNFIRSKKNLMIIYDTMINIYNRIIYCFFYLITIISSDKNLYYNSTIIYYFHNILIIIPYIC